jgi:polyisoprenyl-phosphate glycosyltransferase
MKTIDIVVAVRNEELTIPNFVNSIRKIKKTGFSIRMIFVEDGSTDNTVELLKGLSNSSDDIAYYSLYNPIGPGLAVSYGILKSRADAVITMDVDGSHSYDLIILMIDKFTEGYDIIQARRIGYNRKHLFRKIGSKIYFPLFSLFTGVNLNKQNVHFRLMNRKAIEVFRRTPKTWMSVRLKNSKRDALKIDYINFEAHERNEGSSNFNLKRLIAFAYMSFLTLTDVPMFIMLNVLLLCAAGIIYYFISPVFASVILVLFILDIYYYITANTVDYLKRITVLEYYDSEDQKAIN